MGAFAVKEQSALGKLRVHEKLAIQEAYCALRDIEFEILDSSTLKSQHCENLERLNAHAVLDKCLLGVFEHWLLNFIGVLSEDRHERIAEILEKSAQLTGVPYQRSAYFLYHAIWTTKLTFDWSKPFVLEMAASELELYPNHA